MRLSNFLQSPDFLASLSRMSKEELRSQIFTKGRQWFDSYPEESMVIAKNLRALAVPATPALMREIQTHILLHYYEKMLPMCLSPETYYRYLVDRVAVPPEFSTLSAATAGTKGVVLATCHFGAVECIAPALAARGISLTGALRFSTSNLSAAARAQANELAASGLFAQINFVEIGNAQSPAALDMAAVIRRGGVLLAVFDERTQYSVPVTLLKKRVWGGAGLDRLIRFAQPDTSVFTVLADRTDSETYSLHLHQLHPHDPQLVQAMYLDLEAMLARSLAQWYFLHEEIPFVN
jgi:lauroyl/myristoyl acyltransferase